MPKLQRANVTTLSIRISDVASPELYIFVEDLLSKGMTKSSILEHALGLYRKHSTGELFVDVISKHLPNLLVAGDIRPAIPDSKESNIINESINNLLSGDFFK